MSTIVSIVVALAVVIVTTCKIIDTIQGHKISKAIRKGVEMSAVCDSGYICGTYDGRPINLKEDGNGASGEDKGAECSKDLT